MGFLDKLFGKKKKEQGLQAQEELRKIEIEKAEAEAKARASGAGREYGYASRPWHCSLSSSRDADNFL